jgi:ADP-heptose:LPS heptosyltransferase
MKRMHFKLYFPRWFWPNNLGDSIMLSSVFKAIKETYSPCFLEVITDETLVNTFHNDLYADKIREPHWWEKGLPEKVYKKKLTNFFINFKGQKSFVIWPDWQEKTFKYLSKKHNLDECINSPYKNIISYNFASQISDDIANFHDLRPRIYLTQDETSQAKKELNKNSIAINIAEIRYTQKRTDGENLRYKRESWETLVSEIKHAFPSLTVCEVGQDKFEGIGDKFIPNCSFRKLASLLNEMKLVILSDGGVHNVCNAIDKKVILFQAYEWNPPDLFKMHNAIFNESLHEKCRKRCHLFSDILNLPTMSTNCNKKCYILDPTKLACECINYLKESHEGTSCG